jgi:N-sulfoglucosamine sulfohydrolase
MDKPFFAYINLGVSHESQARATPEQHAKNTTRLTAAQRLDPAKITLPPYYPDTPAVRRTVANHLEDLTAVDYSVGDILATLEARGLAKNTIIFCFGDHGWGLPRGKRWTYDSGTRVPLLIRFPNGVDAGTTRTDLTCFLDLGPSVLSLAGVDSAKPRPGRILFGPKREPAPAYVVSCRDRMDEAEDRIRSLRDERYRYVRNFRPELPYFQYLNYLDEMPIMKDWRRLAFEGKLNDVQKLYWTRTKPREELYDLDTDPHEIRNLAAEPNQATRLDDFRTKLATWIMQTQDLGEVPESELIARGIVKDVLTGEYKNRVKLHPKGPPVP